MSQRKSEIQLNSDDLKQFLNHIISNNRYLQDTNRRPVAVEIVGESGIGKTSLVLSLAEELGIQCVKKNFAQIEELGDLVGFPIRQFKMVNSDNDEVWVEEHFVQEYISHGYRLKTNKFGVGEKQMTYCPPEWIVGLEDKGGILLLDDWNRGDMRFIQALMELIDRQEYYSWKLPKDWHIILTSNPDDGNYQVTSMDNAQKTRFISTNLKFDENCWAKWAEDNSIDGRCINFILKYPEVIKDGVKNGVNSRAAVMFFNSISSIKSFEDDLPLIQMIGEGSVGENFAGLFTTFINNKLDKLLSPQEILLSENEANIIQQLKTHLQSGTDRYRADIAHIISTRIINYSAILANDNKVTKELITRLSKLIKENIFNEDIRYNIVKQIYASNPTKYKVLVSDPVLVNYILGDNK